MRERVHVIAQHACTLVDCRMARLLTDVLLLEFVDADLDWIRIVAFEVDPKHDFPTSGIRVESVRLVLLTHKPECITSWALPVLGH